MKYLYFRFKILRDIGYESGGHPEVRENISHSEYFWRRLLNQKVWKESK